LGQSRRPFRARFRGARQTAGAEVTQQWFERHAREAMSSKRTTAPPAPKHSRSSSSGRKGLIAKKKREKQSAKKRTTLDNPFHRTVLTPASPTVCVPSRGGALANVTRPLCGGNVVHDVCRSHIRGVPATCRAEFRTLGV